MIMITVSMIFILFSVHIIASHRYQFIIRNIRHNSYNTIKGLVKIVGVVQCKLEK